MSNRKARQPLEEKLLLSLLQGEKVLAAVSGGADSMALLDALRQSGIPVAAAHLNHCLRGAESDGDEQLVLDYCTEYGIPVAVRRVQIGAIAAREGLGLEECGRRERYAFLEEARRELGCTCIATAHTLSDQLETMLFRLARGTGLSGLCGIPERRGNIVRPLLRCTRAEVEDYCARRGVPFRTDSSNRDPRFSRNRIRLEAVPALLAVNPGAERHAGQLAGSLASDRDFLEREAEALYSRAQCRGGLSVQALREAHQSLLVRAVGMLLAEEGLRFDYPLLCAAAELARKGSGTLGLPGGYALTIRRGVLRAELPLREEPPFEADFPLPAGERAAGIIGEFALPDGRKACLRAETAEDFEKNKKIYNSDLIFSLDYDTIVGNISIRRRWAGDSIRLPGRPGSRPLRKLWSEAGLPLRERAAALVAADSRGVVWAEHTGPDSRSMAGEGTRLILLLTAAKEGERQL